jgi:excisionase family DNA binding protein
MNNNAKPPATPALLDYASAQRYLGQLSRSTLKALAADRQIRVVRIGRRALFRRDDLDAYIERQTASSREDGSK